MIGPLKEPTAPADALPWIAPALADGVRAIANTALATPPATMTLARAVLSGRHRELLEAEISDWGPFGVEAGLTRLLVGQMAARYAPAPVSAMAYVPLEVCALEALRQDMRADDETVALDDLTAGVLVELVAPLTRGARIGPLFDAALAQAGERPTFADARVLATVARAAHMWIAQPIEPHTDEGWLA